MPLHRRPSLQRDPEPRDANEEACSDHGKGRPFVLPRLMASAPMISELATSSARPDGFPLRIDQIDIGLEDRDLVGRTD
jgi:hypothetical protein